MQTNIVESISLFFRQGASDKVYQAQLKEVSPGQFSVDFQYGRRGGSLQSGSKTSCPIVLEKAKPIYDKLVASKISSGYTPGESGSAYQGTVLEARVSDFLPQLLNPIEAEDVPRYINDDRYACQAKKDGERRGVRKCNAVEAEGYNRKGLIVPLSMPQAEGICGLPSLYNTFTLDAESVGDTLYVFDALAVNGTSIVNLPFSDRFCWAEDIVNACNSRNVVIVPVANTKAEKQALFDAVKASDGEGVCFKLKSAVYEPGRPASGGSQFKFKFFATISCICEARNENRRSVSLSLVDADGQRVAVGNVTIPANYEVPMPGQIVEVRYLYVAQIGGALYQPIYLGVRSDIDIESCSVARQQLKYKSTIDGEQDQ